MKNKKRSKIDIMSQLQFFDLRDKEVDIYLSVLEMGPSSIQQIADATKLKRASIYMYIDLLMEKGFINETRLKKKKLYMGIEPDRIKDLYSMKKYEFNQMEKHIDTLVSDIKIFCPNREKVNPASILYYEGKGEKGLIDVYEDTLREGKNIYTFTAWDNMLKVLPEYLPEYVKRRASSNIHSTCIAVDSKISREIAKRDKDECRHTKFLKNNTKLSIETIIYGDKIAMLHFGDEYVGVIIQSEGLATAQRVMFQGLWEKL